MHEVELVLALLVVVAALAPAARRLGLPYPILLVVGGLALALIPGVPEVELSPDLALLLFLPPLLYIAAFNTSIRDVRGFIQPILSLAVGLVLLTIVAVAALTHALRPELGWPACFALGAIVSPPDAVAAAAVFKRLSVPRRLVTLLEGESLFNDATALVAYRAAIAAMGASFSAGETGTRFVLVAVGGVLVGLVTGKAIAWLREQLDDPPVEITISLLTPFAAYLPAERLGASGVLAVVTAGLYLGWSSPRIMGSDARVRGRAVWDMAVFILNGLVFILIGLQLSTIVGGFSAGSLLSDLGFGLMISVAVILVRLVWVVASALMPGRLGEMLRGSAGPAARGDVLVVGWAGMRGVVSLATALALPLNTPGRDLLVFATFCVILVTLVGQGLTLPWLIRTLGIVEDVDAAGQERRARAVATDVALARIEALAEEWPAHLPLVEALRAQYSHRSSHLGELALGDGTDEGLPGSDEADQELLEHRLIRHAVVEAEREALLDLRTRGEIDEEVWRLIERDIDLEELRMEA
jgi:monovalent cation/hydrogen antiporter